MADDEVFEPIEKSILGDMIERHGAARLIRHIADVVAQKTSRTEFADRYALTISRTHSLAREYELLRGGGGGI